MGRSTPVMRDEFIRYLCTRYRGKHGRSLSIKGATDAASRLKRLEKVFGFDIEALIENLRSRSEEEFTAALKIELNKEDGLHLPTQALVDGKSAAYKYFKYTRWKARRKEILDLWSQEAQR